MLSKEHLLYQVKFGIEDAFLCEEGVTLRSNHWHQKSLAVKPSFHFGSSQPDYRGWSSWWGPVLLQSVRVPMLHLINPYGHQLKLVVWVLCPRERNGSLRPCFIRWWILNRARVQFNQAGAIWIFVHMIYVDPFCTGKVLPTKSAICQQPL